MYNNYKNGTEAWWAMKDALDVEKKINEAVDEMCGSFEQIISELEDACNERDEVTEERDQLQTELDEVKANFEELVSSKQEMITQFTNLKVAAEAISRHATRVLVLLGALNDVQEGADDSSDGTPGDGRS